MQGILERGKGDKLSRVILNVVKTTRRPELCGNVREHVKAGSTVCTDALMSYDDLERDYDRQIIDHLECYARGEVHTNGLETSGRCSSALSKEPMLMSSRFIYSDTAMSKRFDLMNAKTVTKAASLRRLVMWSVRV